MAGSWDDPDKVAEYLTRIPTVPPRLAGESALVEILPLAPRTVVDLGCGDGRLARLVLQSRPTVERVVLIDRSEPMLERAQQWIGHDRRVSLLMADLNDPLPALPRADLIVTGFAVHHLADQRKQALYREAAELLETGGVFANLEVVRSATPELHARFRVAIGRSDDDPEDQLADVGSQLRWLRSAGLVNVDCIWRWRGFALMAGERPAGR